MHPARFFTLALAALVSTLSTTPVFASRFADLDGSPGLRSESAMVISEDGSVIYSKDAETVRPIASLTKLMTAMVILDAGLDPDEAAKVRSQNRAKVIQFFTKLQRTYEQGEKKLNSAKYLEDVNALKNLREAENIDISMLDADEQAFVMAKKQAMDEKLNKVRNLQRQRSRELDLQETNPEMKGINFVIRKARVEAEGGGVEPA